jgi:hypothetical protein
MIDLATIEGAKALLSTCLDTFDWRMACNAIKYANGGGYPSWWFAEIVESGFGDSINGRWGKGMKIRVAEIE